MYISCNLYLDTLSLPRYPACHSYYWCHILGRYKRWGNHSSLDPCVSPAGYLTGSRLLNLSFRSAGRKAQLGHTLFINKTCIITAYHFILNKLYSNLFLYTGVNNHPKYSLSFTLHTQTLIIIKL